MGSGGRTWGRSRRLAGRTITAKGRVLSGAGTFADGAVESGIREAAEERGAVAAAGGVRCDVANVEPHG